MENTHTAVYAATGIAHVRGEALDGYEKIGEIAKQFGVTLRTLRFYEDKGLLAPKRDGAMRLYSRRDKGRLKLILLGRKVGFSLREVKQMIDLYEPAGANTRQLKVALEKCDKQVVRLQKQRELIDESIKELAMLQNHVKTQLTERASQSAAKN